MNVLKYKNSQYRIRALYHKEFGEVLIATLSLADKLISDDGKYFSDEARIIDEQIFYYVEPYQIKLPDSELHRLVTVEVK
jgi:hypothetical protein